MSIEVGKQYNYRQFQRAKLLSENPVTVTGQEWYVNSRGENCYRVTSQSGYEYVTAESELTEVES